MELWQIISFAVLIVLVLVMMAGWAKTNKEKLRTEKQLSRVEAWAEKQDKTINFLRYGLYEAELAVVINKDSLPVANIREAYVRVVPEKYVEEAGEEFDRLSAFPKRPLYYTFFVASEGRMNTIFSELSRENGLYQQILTVAKEQKRPHQHQLA